MPIYIYRCTKKSCAAEREELRPIARVYEPVYCNDCGYPMQNVIARPARMVRGQGGWSSPAPKG